VVSYSKTLRDREVSAMLDAVAAAAHDQFGADRI
jgi:phenylalanyl-tRNA synthetase beta subunit